MKLVIGLCFVVLFHGFLNELMSERVAWASGSASAKKYTVTVSHSGLVQLAQAIFPSGTEVLSFVPPGASAETFDPSPQAILKVNQSQYFFASAVPFEKVWLPKLVQGHRNTKFVDLFSQTQDGEALNKNSHAHDHRRDNQHDHVHDDPHFWLVPRNLQRAAQIMAAELAKVLDAHEKEQLEQRLKVELASLEKLDAQLREMFKPFKGKSFFIFHPSWGEFAESYEIGQEALEKYGHSPTPKFMQGFLELMKKQQAKTIFVQPQMSQKEALTVAAQVGAKLESVDPLALDLKAEIRRFAELVRKDFESRK